MFGLNEVVERGNPVGLSRRNREPVRDVVERTVSDPPDRVLDRMERWEKEVSPCGGRVEASVPHMIFGSRPLDRSTPG